MIATHAYSLGETWTALVHGMTGQVVASPPRTRQDTLRAWATLAVMVAVASLALCWVVLRILRPFLPGWLRALFY